MLGTHRDTVHDIAWAPSVGRSYHLIATASREPNFQVLLSGIYCDDLSVSCKVFHRFTLFSERKAAF